MAIAVVDHVTTTILGAEEGTKFECSGDACKAGTGGRGCLGYDCGHVIQSLRCS